MSATPPTKAFVFVLMPIRPEFEPVYAAIKRTADSLGAYAERVDEQQFHGRITDRIYNQIERADVIVADMSGRNANVFYEVGYAHARQQHAILLTSSIGDIPFDLNDWPHLEYGDVHAIEDKLRPKPQWAIEQSRQGKAAIPRHALALFVNDQHVPQRGGGTQPIVSSRRLGSGAQSLTIRLVNAGQPLSRPCEFIYLQSSESDQAFCVSRGDDLFEWSPMAQAGQPSLVRFQVRLPAAIPALPPESDFALSLLIHEQSREVWPIQCALRLCYEDGPVDYPFTLTLASDA